ncbi:hypothetical protein DMUE_2689 [Dictyocoela muelleri]|nr:hypothetical protein DMUE_2689 [Dictyocoela muelleri]
MKFITNLNLNILSKSKVWLVDRTFYTAPKNYSQIYIIHGLYFGKIVHSVIFSWKIKERKVIEKNEYFIANISTEPEHFIVYFKMAKHNAIKKHKKIQKFQDVTNILLKLLFDIFKNQDITTTIIIIILNIKNL